MSFLKTLNLTSVADDRTNPVLRARIKLVSQLRDQLKLIDEPSHSKTVGKWVKIDGEKHYRERVLPVRRWWRATLDGQVVLTLRTGVRKIEFEKGKTAILLKSVDVLKSTIDGLIEATNKGELDTLLGVKNTLSLPNKTKIGLK